jgi:tRNA(fMet)-specific endonuclease VapC
MALALSSHSTRPEFSVTYFLDTNIVVFCLRGKSAPAMRRLHAVPAGDVRVPLQVHAELLVGAAKSADPARAHARVTSFLMPFAIAWPNAQVEQHYVSIRTDLEARGTPISEADLWIAATARAGSGIVVTNNVREFSRVPNLSLEDWTTP